MFRQAERQVATVPGDVPRREPYASGMPRIWARIAPWLISLSVAAGVANSATTDALAQTLPANAVVYEGSSGPGRGKHIVFVAGDQEYRSEEALPMLARLLARHYGFKTTVFFARPFASR